MIWNVKRVFLDMDGVLADFVGAIHRAHGRPNCYDDPANFGKFDFEKIWGMSLEEVWTIDTFEFWDTIEKTPEADAIVKFAVDWVGWENIAIVTFPSDGPGCVPGKRAWMKRHFPKLAHQMVFTSFKQALAYHDSILIDDADKNVTAFRNAGGLAVLLPRPWNSAYAERQNPLGVIGR